MPAPACRSSSADDPCPPCPACPPALCSLPPADRAQDETGFLFEAGNTEQLAGYVERLITDRPLAETMAAAARTEAERLGWEECTTKLREETYLQAVRNHRERQADVRTLRQKLKRYKEALAKGSRADVFAFFGDRKAEREAEKLEIEEWQLVEDIETLVSAPHRPFQLPTRPCHLAVMRSCPAVLTPRSTRPRGHGRRRSQPRGSSLGGSRRASTCRCGSGHCCSSRGASSPRSCASSADCFFHFSAVAARTRTHHSR